ncbi:MAG TPA: Clp protease N-terminal domain-containing protein [Candidatus Limnocylindria bacterium]|nr:Clp protease N-terminal domain-containing protein [Candidatus Limnocylindria bacterium]
MRASDEALALGHRRIRPEHILLALLRTRDAVTDLVLAGLGIDPESLVARLLDAMSRAGHRAEDGPDLAFTRRGWAIVEGAIGEAQALRHPMVYPEHLLAAIVAQGQSVGAQLLIEFGGAAPRVRAATAAVIPQAQRSGARQARRWTWIEPRGTTEGPDAPER